MAASPTPPPPPAPEAGAVHRYLALALQAVIVLGIPLSLYERQWLNAAALAGILYLTALPRLLGRRWQIVIPPEFELAAIAFIFAALFLGETRGFYGRFWWWDIALHTTSGGLLGILGVLLVYVLNETPRIEVHMRPGFVAFFAFCFALTIGAIWEVFEFSMDQLFGMNMQKPMLGDDSGLTDTMWDLIVDAIGALAVSLSGYVYMRIGAQSFVEEGIRRFVAQNPRLFRRRT
jgi:uncharacterized membrane protein YjdF